MDFIFISLGSIPRNEIAGHVVTLYLTFWGTVKLFKVAASFRIPTSNG